ncbi:hypothetical protein BGZ54_007021 [Gamsiella multidivaricata]|nr:hypothetical protein BGZ54_007021 [Gamsiella multidivaricata]
MDTTDATKQQQQLPTKTQQIVPDKNFTENSTENENENQIEIQNEKQPDPFDSFESPAFIVQSPTATMTQTDPNHHHAFAFPLLANMPRLHLDIVSTSTQSASTSSPLSSGVSSYHQDLDSLSSSSPSASLKVPGLPSNNDDLSNTSFGRTHGHGRSLSVDTSSTTPRPGIDGSSSTPGSRRSSFSRPIPVKETLDACVTETADGRLKLKQYVLERIIGQGAYGIVNLGIDVDTGIYYAIKEFSKSKLRKKDRANLFMLGRGRGRRGPEAPLAPSSPLDMIRGEIAILKKLNHENIVKLYEVLDVAKEDSMFMVFELCERGVLTEVTLGDKIGKIFEDEECRDVFAQMVLGIEYLHDHDIIHRDIKPDNLLRSSDGTLKIVDFGVSEMFAKKGHDLTKKSAGSPAFMAPELCRYGHGEVSGRATDIWSMGVTLYCIRYGRLPFRSTSPLELQTIIREKSPDLEEEQDPRFRSLMQRLLEKDPTKRITIDELRNDPWLTDDGHKELKCKELNTETAVTEVTEDELNGAIQRINGLMTLIKAVAKFKKLIKSPALSCSSSSSLSTRSSSQENVKSVQCITPVSSTPFSSPISFSSKSKQFQDADETKASCAAISSFSK